jgi:ubiquinone/menaquinone biosynthesis C-methylase UbiE
MAPHEEEQKNSLERESSRPSFPGEKDVMAGPLWHQHKQLSELMGGVLPPWLEPSRGSRVLAIGRGAGGLVYEMALRYPTLHITGIDTNAPNVEQAQTLVRGLGNVTILAQDILHLEDKVFPSASFDLIDVRFLTGNVTLEQFPPLMQSLARICRPGGLLVWTEAELPITTSPACQHLCAMIQSGLQAGGHAFTPGDSMGVTGHMDRWLSDAGYRIMKSEVYAIDISAGSKGHDAFVRQVWISGEQTRTFLLEMGIITAAEFEDVFLQIQREIQEETFCGMLYVRMLVGVRLKVINQIESAMQFFSRDA